MIRTEVVIVDVNELDLSIEAEAFLNEMHYAAPSSYVRFSFKESCEDCEEDYENEMFEIQEKIKKLGLNKEDFVLLFFDY